MKRVIRTIWVVCVNGFFVWVAFKGLAVGDITRHWEPWAVLFLAGVLPVVGIVHEILNLKMARWINVGWLILAALSLLLLREFLMSPRDIASDIALYLSGGLFVSAVVTEILYRLTRSKEPPTTDEMLEEMVRQRERPGE